MINAFLVPEKTEVTARGDGYPVAIESAASRVFLVLLNITGIVEQESIELSMFGSVDGQTWPSKPLLIFPQMFYCGETSMLLDVSDDINVKLVRAHWEVNRWGRGSEQPRFEITVTLKEVPKEMLSAKAP